MHTSTRHTLPREAHPHPCPRPAAYAGPAAPPGPAAAGPAGAPPKAGRRTERHTRLAGPPSAHQLRAG